MKDKITVLCVEDGSVDVASLEEDGIHSGQILVYRQGSRPPYALEVDKPEIAYITYERWEALKEFVEEQARMSEFAKQILNKMYEIQRGE